MSEDAMRRTDKDSLMSARAERAQARANVQQAAMTLAHMTQLEAVQNTALERQTLIARFVDDIARIGSETADSVQTINAVADVASAAATKSISLMSGAAASISAAAKAADLFLHQIAGLTEVVQNEARETPLAYDALRVLTRTRELMVTADSLRRVSMQANMSSASSRAEAAQRSAVDTTKRFSALADLAEQSRTDAAKTREDIRIGSVKAASDATKAAQGFVMRVLAETASTDSLNTLNDTANLGLVVECAECTHAEKTGLCVSVTLSELQAADGGEESTEEAEAAQTEHAEEGEEPKVEAAGGYCYFLVPAEKQSSFRLAHALALTNGAEKGPPSPVPSTAQPAGRFVGPMGPSADLHYTIDAERVRPGESYVAFVLKTGTTTRTEFDLSMPSEVVTLCPRIDPESIQESPGTDASAGTPTGDKPAQDDADSSPGERIVHRLSLKRPSEALGKPLKGRCCLVRWDIWKSLDTALGDALANQPDTFFKSDEIKKTDGSVATCEIVFKENDLDVFGDLLELGVHYVPVYFLYVDPSARKREPWTAKPLATCSLSPWTTSAEAA